MTVGERIKGLREGRYMTQRELALKLDITEKSVSRHETGASPPRDSLLLKYAFVFEMDINEFLHGVDEAA